MKLRRRSVIAKTAVLFFSFALFPVIAAGQRRPNPPPRAIGPNSEAVRESQARDMNVRRLELEKEREEKPVFEASKETTKQVLEDFELIQNINADVIRDYSAGTAPDYKHLSEVMAELSKRAARLNNNLLLPPIDDKASVGTDVPVKVKIKNRSPLLDLNDLIYGFVNNPIFKNRDTIDVGLGRQAKRDLQTIINLSEAISKSAYKLSRTTK